MSEVPSDFRTAVFAKTSAGQQEIQSRSMGLGLLVRRLLVLVDGKRTGAELEAFAGGKDVVELLTELMDKGLADVQAARAPAPGPSAPFTPQAAATQPTPAPPRTDWLAALPPAEARSAKDLDMARNFMTNTVNSIFGHHNRISLVEAIHGSHDHTELRRLYAMWVTVLETSSTGKKRLPELREKLFTVL